MTEKCLPSSSTSFHEFHDGEASSPLIHECLQLVSHCLLTEYSCSLLSDNMELIIPINHVHLRLVTIWKMQKV